MIDLQLIDFMREELSHTPREFQRYMYNRTLWENRMVGIVGFRDVGKSTMEKQFLIPAGTGTLVIYCQMTPSEAFMK